jgi:hypothetical protein
MLKEKKSIELLDIRSGKTELLYTRVRDPAYTSIVHRGDNVLFAVKANGAIQVFDQRNMKEVTKRCTGLYHDEREKLAQVICGKAKNKLQPRLIESQGHLLMSFNDTVGRRNCLVLSASNCALLHDETMLFTNKHDPAFRVIDGKAVVTEICFSFTNPHVVAREWTVDGKGGEPPKKLFDLQEVDDRVKKLFSNVVSSCVGEFCFPSIEGQMERISFGCVLQVI